MQTYFDALTMILNSSALVFALFNGAAVIRRVQLPVARYMLACLCFFQASYLITFITLHINWIKNGHADLLVAADGPEYGWLFADVQGGLFNLTVAASLQVLLRYRPPCGKAGVPFFRERSPKC